MSTIQISSGVKRSRTSAPTALAALLAVGLAAVVTAAPAVAQEKMIDTYSGGEEAQHPVHHG